MRVFVKICGLTRVPDVAAAVAAGADAVGFVLAESPRRVTPAQAVMLAQGVPPGIVRVAVMRHPAAADCAAALAQFLPDWLQTDAGDFAALTLPAAVERLPVFRDLPELDADAVARAPRALFEAAQSGTGTRPDEARAAALVAALAARTQLILAGGLTPENVGAAIRRVRPWGVDVSSGVEASPGRKDAGKIRAFVAAVRQAERESAHAEQ